MAHDQLEPLNGKHPFFKVNIKPVPRQSEAEMKAVINGFMALREKRKAKD